MTSMPEFDGVRQDASGCILLFGLPRSGTTWLGKLFDSHPDTLYRHEPDTWRRLPAPIYPDFAGRATYVDAVQSFVADLPAIRAPRVAAKLPVFPKTYLSPARFRALKVGVALAHLGSRLYSDFPILLYDSASAHSGRRVVWKSIESLGRMGIVMNALPDATGIHILRHPCGQIESVLRGLRNRNFGDNTSPSEDYGIFKSSAGQALCDTYGLSIPALECMTPEERLAWQWVMINEKALQECRQTGRVMCVRYEDVCREPLAQVTEMFRFAGLGVDAQTQTFVSASTSRSNGRYYSVFKDPEAAATRWHDELNGDVVERVMAIVRRSRVGHYYSAHAVDRAAVS